MPSQLALGQLMHIAAALAAQVTRHAHRSLQRACRDFCIRQHILQPQLNNMLLLGALSHHIIRHASIVDTQVVKAGQKLLVTPPGGSIPHTAQAVQIMDVSGGLRALPLQKMQRVFQHGSRLYRCARVLHQQQVSVVKLEKQLAPLIHHASKQRYPLPPLLRHRRHGRIQGHIALLRSNALHILEGLVRLEVVLVPPHAGEHKTPLEAGLLLYQLLNALGKTLRGVCQLMTCADDLCEGIAALAFLEGLQRVQHAFRPQVGILRRQEGHLAGNVRLLGECVGEQAGQARCLRLHRRHAEALKAGGHGVQVKGLEQPGYVIPMAQEKHLVFHTQLDRLCLQGQEVGAVAHQHEAGTGFPLMQPCKGLQQEGLVFLVLQAAHMAHHQAVRQAVMSTHFRAHHGVVNVSLRVNGVGDDGKGQIHRRTGPLSGFLRARPEHIGITIQSTSLDAMERPACLAAQGGVGILRVMAMGNAHRDAVFRRKLEGRHVVEHALIVPDHVVFFGMLLKKGADGPVVLHRILAAAGDHKGTPDLLALLGVGGILIAGEEVELHAFGINSPAISHQEVLHAAGCASHTDHQHAHRLGFGFHDSHSSFSRGIYPYSSG